jgi:hypothetical protein
MSISRFSVRALPILPVIAGLVVSGTARASVFTVASDGGTPANGANVYAQSFSPSVSTAPEDPTAYTATPSPQPAAGATVYLTSFQFYASGTYSGTQAAGNTSTYLIIEDTGPSSGYANFSGLTPSTVTGVSTNTVDTTPADNTAGNPLVWTFNNVPVTYGDYLTAAMATISGSTITYIPADIQLVQYTEIGSTYYPDYNYGGGPAADSSVNTTSTTANYNAAAFYTYGGSYFGAGSNAEDATFTASFLTAVPEPVSAGMVSLLGLVLIGRRRGPAL